VELGLQALGVVSSGFSELRNLDVSDAYQRFWEIHVIPKKLDLVEPAQVVDSYDRSEMIMTSQHLPLRTPGPSEVLCC